MSRVFLIHGWGGSSQQDWFPWATKSLTELGFQVICPDMPDTDKPTISTWVTYFSQLVGTPQADDIYIGHSIGCQTILRYLEASPSNILVNKVILVAPWFTLTNLDNQEAWDIAGPWLKTKIEMSKVVGKAKKYITLFSDDDPWVPYEENKRMFEKTLCPVVITLHHKGHLTADEGSTELPELLELL